jgi:hypothetical protein
MSLSEQQIEAMLIEELRNLKYVHRDDITDRAATAKHNEFLDQLGLPRLP